MDDKSKMIDFISSQLPDGYGRLILAEGIVVDVMVCDDELLIEPVGSGEDFEWISYREIYEHLRWHAMPGWEQRKWLRRTMPIVPSAQVAAVPSNVIRYRFQKVGKIWHIHFPVGDEVKIRKFRDSVGLQRMAMLLAAKDRWVPSTTLFGIDDQETLGIIAANSVLYPERRYGVVTVKQLEMALGAAESRVESAKLKGDINAQINAEDELEKFKNEYGATPKDFFRLLKRKEYDTNDEKTIHDSVNTNRKRFLTKLCECNMKECADHLKRNVISEGYGFAYRTQGPAPDWVL
jgi:hypothetical protein